MITIRTLRPDESFSLEGQPFPLTWNPAHVLLAERDGVIVGHAVVWDAGHSIVRVEELDATHAGVMRALWRDIAARYGGPNRVCVYSTSSPQFAAFMEKRGGQTTGATFKGWIDGQKHL